MGKIRVGTSGWSYRDWVGTFYPKGSRAGGMLSEFFQHFDSVEINSTYYRMPGNKTVEGWIKEASRSRGREFSVKVPMDISHVSSMEEDIERMQQQYGNFVDTVLEPMEEAGVLGAVLFQASPYFTVRGDIKYRMKSEPKVPLPAYDMGMDRLKAICGMMRAGPGDPAVELRNSSWLNEDSRLIEGAERVLLENGTSLVTVDGPSFPWIHTRTSRHNYVRFHGRNREEWFKGNEKDPSGRYSYLYRSEELGERIDAIRIMASAVDRDTRIFFNNHPQGYAPRNAEMLMDMLGIERPAGTIDRFF